MSEANRCVTQADASVEIPSDVDVRDRDAEARGSISTAASAKASVGAAHASRLRMLYPIVMPEERNEARQAGKALMLVRTKAEVAFATAAIIVPGPRGPA